MNKNGLPKPGSQSTAIAVSRVMTKVHRRINFNSTENARFVSIVLL